MNIGDGFANHPADPAHPARSVRLKIMREQRLTEVSARWAYIDELRRFRLERDADIFSDSERITDGNARQSVRTAFVLSAVLRKEEDVDVQLILSEERRSAGAILLTRIAWPELVRLSKEYDEWMKAEHLTMENGRTRIPSADELQRLEEQATGES